MSQAHDPTLGYTLMKSADLSSFDVAASALFLAPQIRIARLLPLMKIFIPWISPQVSCHLARYVSSSRVLEIVQDRMM
jgi:hypothetical protein